MKVVVVGDGKVGSTLCEQLAREGHDVVIIDNSEKALQNSAGRLDVIGIAGNGASYRVQLEAGVPKADLLIAATSSDELNLLCCLLARKIGAKNTIARVRNPDYSEQLSLMKDELGLSMAINPELAASVEISRILRFPAAIQIDTFTRGRVELVEVKIGAESPLDGIALKNLYAKFRIKVLVCAVRRGDQVTIPGGDFILRQGDKITVTSSPANITAFFKAVGILTHKIRTVTLIGGGKISYYLARQLLDMGMKVKIFEIDYNRCLELSDRLPKATIIHGDGTEQELLVEEGIGDADAFVALTDIDEENIIVSMYAVSVGVSKVITKINRTNYTEILEDAGIESVISPKLITADEILRYVRSMDNSPGSGIETLSRLVDGTVEALEFRVKDKLDFLGIPLKDLKLKKNLLIACITRRGAFLLPDGDTCIERGDSVIIVTADHQLSSLADILK